MTVPLRKPLKNIIKRNKGRFFIYKPYQCCIYFDYKFEINLFIFNKHEFFLKNLLTFDGICSKIIKSLRDSDKKWEHSSAGRASALQAEGHRFEPYCSHHLMAWQFSWLERQPVTLEVVGSTPIQVANICGFSSSGRAPPCQGGGSEFEPRNPLHVTALQPSGKAWVCNTLIPSSNLGGASKSLVNCVNTQFTRLLFLQ